MSGPAPVTVECSARTAGEDPPRATVAATVGASLDRPTGTEADPTLLDRVRDLFAGADWTDADQRRLRSTVETAVESAIGDTEAETLWFGPLVGVERSVRRTVEAEFEGPPVRVESVSVDEVRPERVVARSFLRSPRRRRPNDALAFPGDLDVEDLLVVEDHEMSAMLSPEAREYLSDQGFDVEAYTETDHDGREWLIAPEDHPIVREIGGDSGE